MSPRYSVYWRDGQLEVRGEKGFNDFEDAMAYFLHLCKKHEEVFLRQMFKQETKE